MSKAAGMKSRPPSPGSFPGAINAGGHKTWTMAVNRSSIRTFEPLQRESARKEVDHFFETLSTSVD